MPLIAAALALSVAFTPEPFVGIKRIDFKTKDGWTLAADYRPPAHAASVVILVHGVGSSRGEWSAFADRLSAQGVGSLAIDLRGHGLSTGGPQGSGDYRTFDADGEWPRAVEDVLAAARWLEGQGVLSRRIGLAGASIGANLASQAAARRPQTPFLLLLSPGFDYRGVAAVAPQGIKTLAAAAPSDPYAFATISSLGRAGAATLVAPAGHGVQMFSDPVTVAALLRWLVAASKPPQ